MKRRAITFVGAPCRLGHSGERYASGSECVECVRLRSATALAKEKGNYIFNSLVVSAFVFFLACAPSYGLGATIIRNDPGGTDSSLSPSMEFHPIGTLRKPSIISLAKISRQNLAAESAISKASFIPDGDIVLGVPRRQGYTGSRGR